jgi:ribose transport system substrate-binding protein
MKSPILKQWPWLTALAVSAWIGVGCSPSGSESSSSESGAIGEKSGEKPLTIAVIPKGTSHEFWKSIHAGAIKAQRELKESGVNVEIIWKGPLRENDREQQVQIVENFIGRGVDGIALAPLDFEALVAPVETAMDADIPVVIIDSALNTEKIVSYISTDNFKGGETGADRLAELMGGKGKAILLRYMVGSASTERREEGFLKAMKEKYPEIELISTDQHAGESRETAYQAAQNLLNRFGSEVTGVFAPCEPVTVGFTLALQDLELAGGKVKLVGFDTSVKSVEALRGGDVQGLVVQDPLQMGYAGVLKVVDQIQGKTVEKRIDTGVYMVTGDNMDEPEINRLVEPPLKEYLGD